MFIHITLSARNAYGIPSSLFDKVLISDAFLTSISAFFIAIPIPAALSIGISFSESPNAVPYIYFQNSAYITKALSFVDSAGKYLQIKGGSSDNS